jgi:carbonic anhydrase/acetyltransferase-like protein (isoleucine patch superfamily)
MYRYIFEDTRHVPPFNQPASLLTIGVRPLKLHQEELFARYFRQDIQLGNTFDFNDRSLIETVEGEAVVYSDNLWFDDEFFDYFMERALRTGQACRAAFPADDPAFRTYTLKLATNFERSVDGAGRPIFLIDLWYFPNGYAEHIVPVVVPSDAEEMGYYSVPDFMTMERGNLTHFGPQRAVVSIESWVHVYFAGIILSNFGRASRFDRKARAHNLYSLKLLWKAILEQRQLLSSSEVVVVGRNTRIHPTAQITGPASIGENCVIGPGVMIDNCTIGDNVSIETGCTLMMSTVGSNCFLPFRAALYLTAVMENSIIAQNTCLQMCVIGRNSFVGAGSTFTDFNLVEQKPIRAANIRGELEDVGQIVLGSAIGHNCRIGSGMVMFPGRMIESDVVLFASPSRRVISRNISYEESDHHLITSVHARHYPRPDEVEEESAAWEQW